MATSSDTAYSVLLLWLAYCVITVSAEPCIECQDCKTDNCYSKCQKSCNTNSPSPSPSVALDACKGYGTVVAFSVAQSSCDTTMKYCEGPTGTIAVSAPLSALGVVSLTQCENIAYGVCQSSATDSIKSPCGKSFGGYEQCSADDFMTFYKGEVKDQCEQKVRGIAP